MQVPPVHPPKHTSLTLRTQKKRSKWLLFLGSALPALPHPKT